MITIEYESGDPQGTCIFRVHINKEFICTFEHDSSQGHGECLQKAADAVTLHEWADLEIMNDFKGG